MSPKLQKLQDAYVDAFARAFARARIHERDVSTAGQLASNDPIVMLHEKAFARALDRAEFRARLAVQHLENARLTMSRARAELPH